MSYKCERCGTGDAYGYGISTSRHRYSVCHKCWREWIDNGYFDIWFTLDRELADKFKLDFLGKLGEQDVR